MAFVNPLAADNIIEYKLVGAYLGRPTNLVTRWRIFTLDAVADYPTGMSNILSAFHGGSLETAYRACLPTTWGLTSASVQRICEAQVFPPVRSRAITESRVLAGTWPAVVSDQPACAGVIQRYTYRSGKTEQGDSHIGPLANDAAVLGKISAGMVTALGNLVTPMTHSVGYGTTGVLVPVFWRVGTKSAPHQPFFSDIFAGRVAVKIGTERRRGLKLFG